MLYELAPGILKSAIQARDSVFPEGDTQPDFVGDINPDFDRDRVTPPPTFIVLETINPFDQDGEASTGPLFDPNDRFCLRPEIAAELKSFTAEVDRMLKAKREGSDAE